MSRRLRAALSFSALVAALAVGTIVFLARDGFNRSPTQPYPVPATSSRAWDDVFAHPTPGHTSYLVNTDPRTLSSRAT